MTDLAKQIEGQLGLLTAAGIDWLPRTAPLHRATTSVPSEPNSPDIITASHDDARKLSLAVLAKEIATCEKCPELFSTRTQTVFGVGPMSPELLFLGEAPGADEDRQGEPFVGAAGQYLNRIITGCGFRREEVYICNILKCRPPGNATPNATQCANCRPYLDRQLELIRPKVICCLGGVAAKNLLNTSTGIMKLRGQKYDYRGTPVFCTYHPSYLIRMEGDALQNAKRECWDDMKMILRHLGRPIPQKN